MGSHLAVGVDLVEIDRFARAIHRWPRLMARVFTEEEIESCAGSANAEERLAARFAVKEAAFKALGNGWPAIGYHDVQVRTAEDGAPVLVLGGRAVELADRRSAVCSLSHERGLALAEVILHAAEDG